MATKNLTLNKAKARAEDEFYTQRPYIEDELSHYKDHFLGKVVYCNCDDPASSEFWKFFVRVFKDWGLKRLVATHYEPDDKNFAYKLEICEDTNGDGKIDSLDDPTITQIPCNGDFRSQACIDLLKEADIVVTNPPFSLWRQYVDQLMSYDKKFLIIGSQNAITCKEVFALLKDNKMWLGYYAGNMEFKVPSYYEPRKTRFWVDDSGQKWRSMGNVCWYTNLDIPKRHRQLDLRGNYYEHGKYYQYDNCPGAIEVKRIVDIPCDFEGIMGVPVTFFNHYSPEQFQVLGLSRDMSIPGKVGMKKDFIARYFEQGSTGQISEGHPDLGYYDKAGNAVVPYRRVMVKLKHPEPRRYPNEN